ncbi:PH domain-containing protein [Georgenia sp. Z1491]|uniref:PH domain-containing protein n=1 Tax=Georgenia sp. Z1491 TaxID=3416707 RepID=UPI003CEC9532
MSEHPSSPDDRRPATTDGVTTAPAWDGTQPEVGVDPTTSTREPTDEASGDPDAAPASDPTPWYRLSYRVIWVDLARSLVSTLPVPIALAFGIRPELSTLWPFIFIAVIGVVGAAADLVRWAFTRYRVTPTHVERRTGVLVRRHRTVRRERIRSVDTEARLHHRLGGLRVVAIGAGQQAAAGESALRLDALATADAERLREELLRTRVRPAPQVPDGPPPTDEPEPADEPSPADAPVTDDDPSTADDGRTTILVTFRAWWVVYHLFSIWAYLMAAGLLWGGYWFALTFGVDLLQIGGRLVDWSSLGLIARIALAVVAGGLVGAVGMGINFLTSFWRFELARVRSEGTSFLRTRRGLLSTREVNRDEARTRGLSIGEPVLGRLIGMADTNVVTTGLSVWDPSEPTAILPRGPIGVARRVAGQVLGDPSPFDAPLRRHPRTALVQRALWATGLAAVVAGAVATPVLTGAVPAWVGWLPVGAWAVGLLGAIVSYRALGHAISGEHLVVRSGLTTRTTTALRRDAVSTIAVRRSLLQRRLGLSTVSAMTAGGWGAYEAPDVAADEAVDLAMRAAPGLVDELLLAERAG